jgi:ribosomal protein S12 methylthiotransferase
MKEAPVTKKVCLVSLGCPKNLVDAEMMLGFLKKDGFDFTTDPQKSDVIVVNTCGFVEDSKKESIEKIFEMATLKKSGNCKVLVATGCLTQRYSRELSEEMPEVDLFVGLGEFDRLSGLLKEKFSGKADVRSAVSHREHTPFMTARQILPDPDLPRILATPKHYSYVKISEGCSHRCSFCVIPHIRGDLRSRPMDSVVREVRQFAEQGVKEFNLIAQDLNEYGKDLRDGTDLTKLLTELDKIPGDFWIRPLYMYPLEFTDRLIGVLRDSEHIVKYVDMPLQHINDRIMRSMKRGSPSRYVRQVLAKLKDAMPEVAVRTTFIVGYPGETEEEFQELYDFVKEYEFDRVGVFQYSREEDTPASTLPEQIPGAVKEERRHRLMSLQRGISMQKNRSLVGKAFPTLYEGNGVSRLSTQAPEIDGVTYLQGGNHKPGEFITAKIIEAKEYDLVAQPF